MSFQFRIIKDEPVTKEVEVITSTERIDTETNRIAEELKQQTQIDGFRKGKVPIELIKARFKSAITAEGMKKIVSEALVEIIKEKNWQLARIDEIKFDDKEPTRFTLRLETIPQFELKDYKGIELVWEEGTGEKEILQRKIDELREAKTRIVVVDRPARVGDLLLIDLKTGKERIENRWVELGDRSLPDEMNEAMVGMAKGMSKEFEVARSDARERWFIRVKEVKEKIVPTDEELIRQLGFTSREEMEEELKGEIEEELNRLKDDQLREKIARFLIERYDFPLPPGYVEEEYRLILSERGENDTPSNRERFMKTAEDRVRLLLIVDRIAKEEGITVSDDEVDQKITEYGKGMNYSDVRIKELKENENIRASIRTMILKDKILGFLLDHAQITKKERIISPWSKDDNRSIRH
ncbi:trigger factor [candidate division WOR-3 bacterium]|uniref:Trigger factor n=1 Tax=candidate division WOR-3 bacterium TaxID=2052148 RepID=A0A660SHF6_UNCW3|nr:MAG: trigger factor [candidate division WOR-3 bacterium]